MSVSAAVVQELLVGLPHAQAQAILARYEALQRAAEEGAERQQRDAQERANDASMLCPEHRCSVLHPEDKLSRVKIDTALTRFNATEIEEIPCLVSCAPLVESAGHVRGTARLSSFPR